MKLSFQPIAAVVAALIFAGPSLPACAAAPMTKAVRKSNDSGVALQYRVDGVAQIGRPVAVFLQFDGVTDPAGATVRFSADPDLALKSGGALTLAAGKSTSATVTLTSAREGLAYLNVFITQAGATSAISIPVQTGNGSPSMKPTGEMRSAADGERIISLPAAEDK